jgi:hypothetical protein
MCLSAFDTVPKQVFYFWFCISSKVFRCFEQGIENIDVVADNISF